MEKIIRYGWFYIRNIPDDREYDAPVNVYRIGVRGGVLGFECSFDNPSEMRTIIKKDEPNAEIIKIPRGFFKGGRWIRE